MHHTSSHGPGQGRRAESPSRKPGQKLAIQAAQDQTVKPVAAEQRSTTSGTKSPRRAPAGWKNSAAVDEEEVTQGASQPRKLSNPTNSSYDGDLEEEEGDEE